MTTEGYYTVKINFNQNGKKHISHLYGKFADILDALSVLMKVVEKDICYAIICGDGRTWFYRYKIGNVEKEMSLPTGEKLVVIDNNKESALEQFGYTPYLLDKIDNITELFD